MVSQGTHNKGAGRLICELRIERGLSPEDLSHEILKAGHGSVSGRTVRRIERRGVVPSVRVQVALARHFDVPASELLAPVRPSSSDGRAVA
jgi:transcriptional regulator with XRE-family HTH domain